MQILIQQIILWLFKKSHFGIISCFYYVVFVLFFSCRTCVYVLGLIAKTKQGCDILKCHSWDSVRHSRKHLWPVVADDVEQLCNELSSVPSTLSLNSESTGSRHNSESESAPSSEYCDGHRNEPIVFVTFLFSSQFLDYQDTESCVT